MATRKLSETSSPWERQTSGRSDKLYQGNKQQIVQPSQGNKQQNAQPSQDSSEKNNNKPFSKNTADELYEEQKQKLLARRESKTTSFEDRTHSNNELPTKNTKIETNDVAGAEGQGVGNKAAQNPATTTLNAVFLCKPYYEETWPEVTDVFKPKGIAVCNPTWIEQTDSGTKKLPVDTKLQKNETDAKTLGIWYMATGEPNNVWAVCKEKKSGERYVTLVCSKDEPKAKADGDEGSGGGESEGEDAIKGTVQILEWNNGKFPTQLVSSPIITSNVSEEEEEDVTTAAWSVRSKTVVTKGEDGKETTSIGFEIFSPIWVFKSKEYVAEGCSRDWSDVPGGSDLYAVMQLLVSCETFEASVASVKVTTDLSDLEEVPVMAPNPNGTGDAEGQDGTYYIVVPIGSFVGTTETTKGEDGKEQTVFTPIGFEQVHLGVLHTADFTVQRERVETNVITSVSLSEDGTKLLINRQPIFVEKPIGKTPEDNPLQIAVGGGSLALGPIEYVDGKFVQYVGNWTYNEDSCKWSFTKKNSTPAASYESATGAFLTSSGSTSSGTPDTLAYGSIPNFGNIKPTGWLTLNSVNVVNKLTYNPPADETCTGALNGSSLSFSYLGTASTGSGDTTILTTIVEGANETTTYESE